MSDLEIMEKKMDAGMKAKWLEALRSGKYQQGIGYLNSEDKFCCLGVLCDISGDGQWESDPDVPECQRYVTPGDWNRTTLPSLLENKYSVYTGPLITMNDAGTPFSEIADYIEKNL